MRTRGRPEPFPTHPGAEQFQAQKQEYRAGLDAADPNNRWMRQRRGLGGTGDQQLTGYKLWYVREVARHMDMNDALPGSITDGLADDVVGLGCRLEAMTGDAELNADIAARFLAWANDPAQVDHEAEKDLHQLAWHMFRQEVMDGDIFGQLLDNGRIQRIEADYCVSPSATETKIVNGIELQDGRPVAAHFTSEPVRGHYAVTKPERRLFYDPATGLRTLLHCYSSHRTSQHRGYTWWHPVMIDAGMLEDLDFAMVLKAQTAASQAGTYETAAGAAPGQLNLGDEESITGADGVARTHVKLVPGSLTRLPPGVKAVYNAANVPNAEHMAHVKQQIKKIGAGMHRPYCILLLDASETNYSGFRGAVTTARQTYLRCRRDNRVQFYTPVYRWWLLRQLPRLGRTALRLAADGVLFKHKFIPPKWSYIEPSKDARADGIIIQEHLDSWRGVLGVRGLDVDDVIQETIEDVSTFIAKACEAAAEINRQNTNAGVTWRDFIRWGAPQGIHYSAELTAMERTEGSE